VYIAVDIGATKIRVASGNLEGILEKISGETDRMNGPEGVSLQIIKMIRELVNSPEAIGVGSIGPINHGTGIITNTPNYPFNKIPVVKPLMQEFEVPVKIVNDCTAGVLGEHVYGAGKGLYNLSYITISTGLGGGAMVDGHLLMGKDGNAVEVGHLTIYPDSEIICGCGGKGHWEAYSSGKNIPKFAQMLLKSNEWHDSLLAVLCNSNVKAITTEMIFDAAKQGDETALWIVGEVGKINAIGIANVINAYDPALITIGGSVALSNPELIMKPIHSYVAQHVINRLPEIAITSLGGDIVLYGALALAVEAKKTH
jgi:glucokinase